MPRGYAHPKGRAATAMPTTSLFAQYDASDASTHTAGSGLWSPKAGSDGTDLVAKDSGGTTQTFSYSATPQGGKSLIACPSSIEFRHATASATTYADATIIMAYRLNVVSRFLAVGKATSGTYYRTEPVDGNAESIVDSAGVESRISKTGLGTANSTVRVLGLVVKSGGALTLLSSGGFAPYSNIWTSSNVKDVVLKSSTATSYGGTMLATGNTGDIDIAEILTYTTADVGQAIQAIQYLVDKWALTP